MPAVEPVPDDGSWKQPPVSEKVGLPGSMHAQDPRRRRFDVALLEELNEEYRDKPIVPAPRQDL